MVIFSAIKELRKDTEEGWKKLAVPLDQMIEANNASNIGLKKMTIVFSVAMSTSITSGPLAFSSSRIQASNQSF